MGENMMLHNKTGKYSLKQNILYFITYLRKYIDVKILKDLRLKNSQASYFRSFKSGDLFVARKIVKISLKIK